MSIFTIARAARAAALGVWLGGVIMAFIAAPIVFKKLDPDRTKAGEIVGAILHQANAVKLGLLAVALLAEGALFFSAAAGAPAGWRKFVPLGTLLGAAVIFAVATLWLEPKIAALRDQIGTFSEANAQSPERIQFRKLHGASMALLLLEAILIGISLIAGLL